MTKFEVRLKVLEDIVTQHLKESGSIQTNLKWNTTITCLIAAALITKFVAEFFKR